MFCREHAFSMLVAPVSVVGHSFSVPINRREHTFSVLTRENQRFYEHAFSVPVYVTGLTILGKPVFGRTISPRSVRPTGGDGASRFWKTEYRDDARLCDERAGLSAHFPRFERKGKSCSKKSAEKRSNFRTRSRSPPRASVRASCASLPKRQVPRLHSATLATRNG